MPAMSDTSDSCSADRLEPAWSRNGLLDRIEAHAPSAERESERPRAAQGRPPDPPRAGSQGEATPRGPRPGRAAPRAPPGRRARRPTAATAAAAQAAASCLRSFTTKALGSFPRLLGRPTGVLPGPSGRIRSIRTLLRRSYGDAADWAGIVLEGDGSSPATNGARDVRPAWRRRPEIEVVSPPPHSLPTHRRQPARYPRGRRAKDREATGHSPAVEAGARGNAW